MKRKILLCLAMLGIAAINTQASPDKPLKNVTARAGSVIEAFVDASISNDAALFNEILNNEAVLKVNRQNQIIAHTKSDLIKFCKKIGGVVLNCAPYYEILSSNDCIVIARVDFKFPEFVQQNYVTIEKDTSGVWKISQINRFNQ